MSGLMVSLAVVVAAILTVLFLVFSDQPATEQVRRLGGRRRSISSRQPAPRAALGPYAAASVLRGPPPATVLQRQLALPATRPRRPAPPSARPVFAPRAPVMEAPRDEQDLEEAGEDSTLGLTIEGDRTFLVRLRSSVSLLVLLALVGAGVALLIGIALFLAETAIQNTVG